ncbi:DUF4134 family protein [Xanthovirga aplysinae]|uniref:DUF4134 family protein n=1 Tax=Xanthovirga aplysinae TaxID=2529853 RepID=UPI0012BD29D0|nr:DUF4134 family protein [Xanthovirga aplysinae]MTI33303.1 DUF4134 domain-containing protein [Xanthovirga aplysinae]
MKNLSKSTNKKIFATIGLLMLTISNTWAQDFGEMESRMSGLYDNLRMLLGVVCGVYALYGLVQVFIKYNNHEEREAKKSLLQTCTSLVIWFLGDTIIRSFIEF